MTPAAAARARSRTRKARTRTLALGYCRVSTAEQAQHGASMAAQWADVLAEAGARGWDIAPVNEPGISGRKLDNRPQLTSALQMLADGRADVLMVTALDRLSRDAHDYLGLVKLAASQGWHIVVLRDGIDTSAPGGELIATIKAGLAQEESRKISERVTRGMAQRKTEGKHMGRRTEMTPELAQRVRELAAQGYGARRVAQALTDEGWETPGGRDVWSDGAARSALRSVKLADEAPSPPED